ncbi:uncharacterized protein TNCV_2388061 [Trichonephila clavipes]|nr:uncharacterized protein TNCV_2388061 [Trichonephila clavipes]
MFHDEIPERCKLNFTGIVDDALRIAGELFPKQTLKKYIRKEVEIDTDGRLHVRRERKVHPPTSKSIHQWDRTLKETGTLVSQTGKYPEVFVIEDTVDRVRNSFCMSPHKSIR